MKKYNTTPIDFTGCHPVIAEALKRGESIECFVWDYEEEFNRKAWVYGYAPDTIYKYKTKEYKYVCAKPIPSKGRRSMKKYNTKPIDFTGCHPVIAEHLKRGEAIECLVWDWEGGSKVKAWVYGYAPDTTYKYKIKEDKYAFSEPIPSKGRRIMPPERAIPVLIAEGWKFDDNGNLVGYATNVMITMFKLMGKPLSDPKVSVWAWPPCIIEEVEDDE